MAGKKPAKTQAGQSRAIVQDPAIYGSPVRYVGVKGSFVECETCGKKTGRGMIRIKNDRIFCCAGCAEKSN